MSDTSSKTLNLGVSSARFWKPAESISIWEEIIDVRKKALEDAAKDETFQMATILASQVSLTRDQLAEWDNSARAWLGFADRAQNVQQTKLKLVIDEMQQPIAPKSSLYESVIEAWTVALRGMEELLKGASQGVSHSGLILALSSWHIYPDLSVRIFHKDSLGIPCAPQLTQPDRSRAALLFCRGMSCFLVAPLSTLTCRAIQTPINVGFTGLCRFHI